MSKLNVITYTTHNTGMYDKLINNNFNIDIVTLGYGTKWISFKHRNEKIIEYLQKDEFKDDDIFIIVDGFDTIINKPLDGIIDLFKSYDKKVLFAENIKNDNFGLDKKVFSLCKNNVIANMGLFMGYKKYLLILLKELIKYRCKDDQHILNKYLCDKFDFVGLDHNKKIFYNSKNFDKNIKYDAIFLGFPGLVTFERITRGAQEYIQFFLTEILVIFLIGFFYLQHKKLYHLLKYYFAFFIALFFYIDKSCINF